MHARAGQPHLRQYGQRRCQHRGGLPGRRMPAHGAGNARYPAHSVLIDQDQ